MIMSSLATQSRIARIGTYSWIWWPTMSLLVWIRLMGLCISGIIWSKLLQMSRWTVWWCLTWTLTYPMMLSIASNFTQATSTQCCRCSRVACERASRPVGWVLWTRASSIPSSMSLTAVCSQSSTGRDGKLVSSTCWIVTPSLSTTCRMT